MERDQVLIAWFDVANLMDVCVLATATATGGKLPRLCGHDATVHCTIEYCFGTRAAEDAHGTTGAAMIVDGASLAISPAEDQRVVCGARAHQISAVRARREFHEGLDLSPVDLQVPQTILQQIQRNA